MNTFRCNKCPEGTVFKTMSDLRKHYWVTHRESFKRLQEVNRNRSKLVKGETIKCKICKKVFVTKQRLYAHRFDVHGKGAERKKALILSVQNGHKELTARELLSQFKIQQTFLNDMITLMERTIESHDKQTIRNT